MKKVLFFSLFLFCVFFSLNAHAFEDTAEYYTVDVNESWNTSFTDLDYGAPDRGLYNTMILSSSLDIRGLPQNTVIKFYNKAWAKDGAYAHNIYAYMTPKENLSTNYISFVLVGNEYLGTTAFANLGLVVKKSTGETLVTFDEQTFPNVHNNSKYEVIRSSGNYDLYLNGSLLQTKVSSYPSYTGDINFYICNRLFVPANAGATQIMHTIYIDDFSTSSTVGANKLLTESTVNYSLTWNAQLMRSYPSSTYSLNLYSLTNSENIGLIDSWGLPAEDDATTAEYGYKILNRVGTIDNYYGVYMVEMTKDNLPIASNYFYLDQLANPQGFPNLLFMGTSSVNSEIRDEDNNGGEIAGGGSVYLYPEINSPANYTFTYNILETPYALTSQLSTVYNTSSINSLTISYTGLLSQNYKVSLDGQEIGSTNGLDTYSYTFTGSGLTDTHIISFSPDYSISGVWGEVKDSVTQTGIKSATVSISGDNISKTIYTDDNGLFYLTKGMEANKTYSIIPVKTGYTTPPEQTAITVNGATTRQDFFMDPLESVSGSGLYYAPHTVSFTVLEYWFNTSGLPGCSYSVVDENTTSIQTGTADSKGQFSIKDMDPGIKYTITLTYNGFTDIEYITPGLTEYTLILHKSSAIVQTYINPWLTLSYTKNPNNVSVQYSSNKTLAGGGATLTATAGNGSQISSQTLATNNGTFLFNYTNGTDYILAFNITAGDGSQAFQNWVIGAPATVNLFPTSYPTYLKNLLFTGICIIFLLAFGKARNEIACGSVAVLTSLGYYFHWLTCSYYFVILIWIIAVGAFVLHYKRTGALG